MFPHGSFLIGLGESLGRLINRADLQTITGDDIRRWRGLYNMTGAEGVSRDRWAQVKARARELGIDWDHYIPISVGMTIEEPDEETTSKKVNKMVKVGDRIEDERSCGCACANNSAKSECKEVDGQIVKPADELVLGESFGNVYEVTVTFKTVIRVVANSPEDAISDAADEIYEALSDDKLNSDNFEYSVKN